MCGIAGIVGRLDSVDLCGFREAAYGIMARRGPNSRGAACVRDGRLGPVNEGPIPPDTSCLLVHTRLAILDLTQAGAQPMIDAAGRSALVFNGEIYNHGQLRQDLGLQQAELRGTSDTEVLFHWLRRHSKGQDFKELVGMFALGFVDLEQGSLLLLRDYYGIKPLFVARRERYLAFASDLRVLLALPGTSREVDRTKALEALRFGGAPLPGRQCILKGIECVLPGEALAADLGHPQSGACRRWYKPCGEVTYAKPFGAAVKELREAFLESVRLHLKADVSVGCALSGGIDSSAIVMAMRLILGKKGDIHTVSHIARQSSLDEERWIDIVNRAAGATGHKVIPVPEQCAEDLDDLIREMGEPFGTTSVYAQYCVFREAKRQGLTVMLDGQGADETLGGYASYMTNYLWELFCQGRWGRGLGILGSEHVRAKSTLGYQLSRLVYYHVPPAVAHRLGWWMRRGGSPRWLTSHGPSEEAQQQEEVYRRRWQVGLKAGLADSVITILGDLLRYEDRNSMRFSIESRVPFLSNRFADLVLSMPPHFIIGPRGQTKYVFREAVRGLVPDAIIERKDKIGFQNDDAQWLRRLAPWVEQLLGASEDRSRLIDTRILREEWERFLRGASRRSVLLWSAFLYLRWLEIYGAAD